MSGEKISRYDYYRKRLEEFYLEKNPNKMDSVSATLKSFEGHEEDLFSLLVEKYGPSKHEKGAAKEDKEVPEEEKKKESSSKVEVGAIPEEEEIRSVSQPISSPQPEPDKQLLELADEDEQHRAAILLQGKARQSTAKKQAGDKRATKKKEEQQQHGAALLLQSKARQKVAVKRVENQRDMKEKEEVRKQHNVAMMLQGKARQKLAIRKVEKLKGLSRLAYTAEDNASSNEGSTLEEPDLASSAVETNQSYRKSTNTVNSPSSNFKTLSSAEQLLADEHQRELDELRQRQAARTLENSAAMMFQGVQRGIYARRQLKIQVEMMDDMLNEMVVQELSTMLAKLTKEEAERLEAEKLLAESKQIEMQKAAQTEREEKSATLMQKHGRAFLAKKKVIGIYESELSKTIEAFAQASGNSDYMTFTQALEYKDIEHWLNDGSLSLSTFLSVWKQLPKKFQGDSINFEVRRFHVHLSLL